MIAGSQRKSKFKAKVQNPLTFIKFSSKLKCKIPYLSSSFIKCCLDHKTKQMANQRHELLQSFTTCLIRYQKLPTYDGNLVLKWIRVCGSYPFYNWQRMGDPHMYNTVNIVIWLPDSTSLASPSHWVRPMSWKGVLTVCTRRCLGCCIRIRRKSSLLNSLIQKTQNFGSSETP